jgi:hypothetical protein
MAEADSVGAGGLGSGDDGCRLGAAAPRLGSGGPPGTATGAAGKPRRAPRQTMQGEEEPKSLVKLVKMHTGDYQDSAEAALPLDQLFVDRAATEGQTRVLDQETVAQLV